MRRRDFVKSAMFGAAIPARPARPNFLFIMADQLSLDAISAHGNQFVRTPNLNRIAQAGVSFQDSYSPYPLCAPARSSLFTGRMPSETGVTANDLGIREAIPNLGQWLGARGYETVYSGKWHMPEVYASAIPGFTVLPGGIGGHGQSGDGAVSRDCQAYLHQRSSQKPFLLAASLLQPHDICTWIFAHMREDGWEQAAPARGPLPPLPGNFHFDAREPRLVRKNRPRWSEQQWRYYLWSYYRHVEMVDFEVGRILDALEDSGHAGNTVVIFTSDHGEGSGHHQLVMKNYLYDEAAKVPLFISRPGEAPAGKRNATHLVSGVDLVPTICDYAGLPAPPAMRGASLRPLVEERPLEWRSMLVSEVAAGGRMVRTRDFKYVAFPNDPAEQLFDWRTDSAETRNVIAESRYAAARSEHRALLREWERRLELAPNTAREPRVIPVEDF